MPKLLNSTSHLLLCLPKKNIQHVGRGCQNQHDALHLGRPQSLATEELPRWHTEKQRGVAAECGRGLRQNGVVRRKSVEKQHDLKSATDGAVKPPLALVHTPPACPRRWGTCERGVRAVLELTIFAPTKKKKPKSDFLPFSCRQDN